MVRDKQRIVLTLMIILCFTTSVFSAKPKVEGKQKMYFTLVAKSNYGARIDCLMLIKQQVARIGINLDVIVQDWPTFVGELIAFRNFDLCYVALSGGGFDPDFTGIYNENGSLNLFGYHTDMDYDPKLGTGKNEWYMRQGNLIMPPNSQERIQHYWDWEQYLMDKILPLQPTFAPNNYMAHWSNLQGYDYGDGILQSWGKMNWTGSHTGQIRTDEVVITDVAWSDLNPFFQDDSSSFFISSAVMDPLIWYDDDFLVWPHIAKNWTHLSDTHVRITLREGIKWQSDPDGNFTDEYLDVEDVYFTLFLCKYITWDTYDWLEDIEIIDKYTLDIFIDGDSSTPEYEPYAPYLPSLAVRILPEHYLNQTQIIFKPEVPDLTHPSWNIFASHAFGTGLFGLTSSDSNTETILNVFPDCWRLNTTITSDPDLNWIERFGDFTGGLNQLRIRHINDRYLSFAEFEQGRVDIEGASYDRDKRLSYITNPDITVQSKTMFYFGFVGYNMRPVRPVIGNAEPWGPDPSITKGLAVRKAISYAIDREEINQIVHGGDYTLTDHPIYAAMGVWCNPNIIRYNHDLDKALTYMQVYEGQSSVIGTSYYPLFILAELLLCGIILLRRRK